jgi:cell division septum initiation protein DivIVA
VNKVVEAKEAVNDTIEQGKAKVEDANARAKEKIAEDREIERTRAHLASSHIDTPVTTTTTTTTRETGPVMGMSLTHEKSKPIIHDMIVSSAEILEDARDTIRESAMNMLHQGKETAHEVPGKVTEMSDKTKSTWTDLHKKAIETKEEIRQLGHDAAEKVRQSLEPASDVAHKDAQERGIDNAMQKEQAASSFIDRVKESVVDLIDKGKHAIMHSTEAADRTDITPSAMPGMITKESEHSIPSRDLPRVDNSTSPFVEHYQEIERPNRDTTIVKDTIIETHVTNKDLNKDLPSNFNKDMPEERADLHKARLDAGEFKFD